MKAVWHSSSRAILLLGLFLFIPAAFVLLGAPIAGTVGVFGFHLGPAARVAVVFAAWLLSISCLLLLRRIHLHSNTELPYLLASYILLTFLIFFGMERLVLLGFRSAGFWPSAHQAGMLHPWIQIASSFLVMGAAIVMLPRIRSIQEGGAAARKEHDRFLAAAESSLDDFYIFDGVPDESGAIVDFRFSYINPNALRRLGATHESLAGKILTEVRPFMITSGLIEKYSEVVRTGKPFVAEVYLDDERIRATWLHVQVVKLGNGIAITSRDITEHRRMLDRIHHMAHHDQLTGLPNRVLLEDRLKQAMLRADREQHRVAIVLIDIDNFKNINDTLGHAQGDAVLTAFAARLRTRLRESDTVARIGGDEFVIVMPGIHRFADIDTCAQHILDSLVDPLAVDGKEVHITVSAGVSIYPDTSQDVEQLLRVADSAMYAVKNKGRNGILTFEENNTDARLTDTPESR